MSDVTSISQGIKRQTSETTSYEPDEPPHVCQRPLEAGVELLDRRHVTPPEVGDPDPGLVGLKVVEDAIAVGHHRRGSAGHGRVTAGAGREVEVAATAALDEGRVAVELSDGLVLRGGRSCQLAKDREAQEVSVAAVALLGFLHQLIVLRLRENIVLMSDSC